MEVLLTLPLVVLTFVSGIHYGIAGVTKQTLQCSASAAAYEAALGGQEADIRQVVDRVLAAHEMSIGEGVFLLVETSAGLHLAAGDASLLPALADRDRRPLMDNEYRAIIVVAREVTAVPASIRLKETEIENQDLIAVATAIKN